VGALAIGLGFASPALAADTLPMKAPPLAAPLWWYEGFAEIGGRFDMNSPDKSTLGKFYEYRDLRPGVFGNFFFGAHRTIDPFDIEVWGKNVGWEDQAYGLDIAKPGSYYLTFGWDETPHDYWQNAKTLYTGIGGNVLTVPDSVRAALNGSIVGGLPTAASNTIINNNSSTIDLRVRRDTGNAAARWTPTDNWDFNVDYSHTHREGTQAMGAVSFSPAASGTSATRSAFELPRPIDDTTQNANLKGEYAGSTPWGKPFNVSVGGGYSNYQNSVDSLTFQNPWNVTTVSPTLQGLRPVNNLYSLPPDNQAGNVSVQGGVGLPFNSRYMGTFQYTNMKSDQSNLPFSINPGVLALGTQFLAPSRETNTFLSNNVLFTQLTSNLQSTLKYRYYSYKPEDNPAFIDNPRPPNPDSTLAFPDDDEAIRHPSAYTKQNADAQIDYRPWKWLNVGASYDWEHWNRTYRETGVTNENTGKIFADSRWGGFSTLRASLQYGQRRYDQYTALEDDSNIAQYRMNDLANRDRTKGQISWAVDVTKSVTITPYGGFLNDNFKTNVIFVAPGSEIGLKKVTSWNAGADATWNVTRDVALFLAYNFESGYRQVYENAAVPLANVETNDQSNTVIFGAKITVIPQKLFLDANYTYTKSTSDWNLSCTQAGCQYTPLAVFPDVHNTLSRLDVQAKYNLDDSFMRNAGFVGKAYLKARLLWEKNSNDSWQGLQNQFGWLVNPTNATTAYSIWMGTGNPNYNVVLGQVSFGVQW
jgi:MtrB/PioB family decaheme-associated outer membrane protein